MIRLLLKWLLYILPPLLLTTGLFWPLKKEIPIEDSVWAFDFSAPYNPNESILKKPLIFPINPEYVNYLTHVPEPRHELCFENKNGVFLLHSDSNLIGIKFSSQDLKNDTGIAENKVGAMSIVLTHTDGTKDEFYREIGQDYCEKFSLGSLNNLSSSTIEYRHISLNITQELNLEADQKILIQRIVGNSYLDTQESEAFIKARWDYFILSFVFLTIGWMALCLFLYSKIYTPLRKWRTS